MIGPARLSGDYSFNEVPLSGWGDVGALLALVVCAGTVALAAYWRRKGPVLFFFVAFFFMALLPSSNLLVTIGSIMAERFLYLPALGFAGCAVYLLRGRARWVLAVACVLRAVRARSRNRDWRDEASLWASATQAAPNSYKVHMAAAGGLTLGAARMELNRALGILEPLPDARNLPIAYVNAARFHRDLGDVAPPLYREACYRKPLETLQRGERIRAATGASGWYQLYEELAQTYRRLAIPIMRQSPFSKDRLQRPGTGCSRPSWTT
jgi:hypothetical protein